MSFFGSIQWELREPIGPEDTKIIIIMKSSLKQSCHLLLIRILLANDYMPSELMFLKGINNKYPEKKAGGFLIFSLKL